MINLAPLTTPITAPAERELPETDPRLDLMITLAEHSKFIPAAEQAEQLWQQRVYDVRTLGFYLFGVFLEQGPLALPRILDGLESTVTHNWPYLGPSDSKQRHLDVALRWLFINLLRHLRFHQRSQDALWTSWLQEWEKAPQQPILQRSSQLAVILGTVLKDPACRGHLLSLRSFLQALPTFKQSQGTPPLTELLPDDPTQTDAGSGATGYDAAYDAKVFSLADAQAAPVLTVPLSFPLQTLIRRLAAFNQLVKLGKFKQAAILYKDIKQSIEKFDPRSYLPSLFGEYFSNIVAYADKLTESLNAADDFAAEALVELYHIDIDLFMAART